MTQPSIQEVFAAHRESLLATPGVVGTAIGRSGDTPCIRVFVTQAPEGSRRAIPDTLGGYPVQIEISGMFRAY